MLKKGLEGEAIVLSRLTVLLQQIAMRAHLLFVVASFLSMSAVFAACSDGTTPDTKDASTTDLDDAGDASSTEDADSATTGPIVISASGRFTEYRVGQTELDAWNTEDMVSPGGV